MPIAFACVHNVCCHSRVKSMTIMQSCCCWRSVRRGSFACAIYTGIYFAVLALTTGKVLQGESEYLRGNRSLPESTSFLEPETISPRSTRLPHTLDRRCHRDVYRRRRSLLVPIRRCFKFRPDESDAVHAELLPSLSKHIFSVVRDLPVSRVYGRSGNRRGRRRVQVRYDTQPPTTTATSYLSSRRAATNNETKVTGTPTQSPTGQNTLSSDRSPIAGRTSKKHVQFPDIVSENETGNFEARITVLVPKLELDNEQTTSLSLLKLEEATAIDQILQSQEHT
ncbi:uncharacterized protein LOC108628499 isoform X4 [Ceratina calcarata]|uniref:Uncharacterized protein LOC108628499 isoform X4 n=1 Tax=Ceratina calcarata TaxID=156304 RepID=A0AAJ7WDD2_9HYME|nr:uncharacterized protein LOC108628499 isoform X4 [Ceratina calcarata]